MAGMNFLILKINGVDVSQMPHEKAVQMFLQASEPILVEVRRRAIQESNETNIENPTGIINSPSIDSSLPINLSTSPVKRIESISSSSPILLPPASPSKRILGHPSSSPLPTSLLILETAEQSTQPPAPPLAPPLAPLLAPPPSSSSLSVSSASSPPSVDLNNLQNSIISSSQSGMSLASSSCGSYGGGLTFSTGLDTDTNTKTLSIIQQTCNNNNEPASSSVSMSPILPVALSLLSTGDIPFNNVISTSDSISEEKVIECSDCTSISHSHLSSSKKCKVYISTGVQTDTFTTDFIFNGSSIVDSDHIENEHHLFEECLAPEIDIEEVTLRKSTSNERIGLTVSHSSGGGNGSGSDDTDTCTEVYISDIIPDGIAARDGRLRHGDQILQVNGRDVSNKEETETLISENKNAVTLLVSRYLYTDEDFNDPAEYYDEDDQKVAYENCLIENCIVEHHTSSENKTNTSSTKSSSNSNKSANKNHSSVIQSTISPSQSQIILKHDQIQSADHLSNSAFSNDPLNHINIKAHLASVNQQIAMLDTRMQNMMMHNKTEANKIVNNETIENLNNLYRAPVDSMRNELTMTPAVVQNNLHQNRQIQPNVVDNSNFVGSIGQNCLNEKFKSCGSNRIIDSETEHIYETIPEDSESEPVYCSPYESSDQNKLVEQWLDMHSADPKTRRRLQQNLPKSLQKCQTSNNAVIWQRMNPPPPTSKSNNSSGGDEHENSSSAYNTGGSCNSNNTQLTLELSANFKDKDQQCQSTLVLCPPKYIVNSDSIGLLHHHHNQYPMQSHQSLPQDFNDNCKDCYRLKKDKVSPTHCQKNTQSIAAMKSSFGNNLCQEHQINLNKNETAHQKDTIATSAQQQQQLSTDTMYTNVANLQQTMWLQQKLFRQALTQQVSTPTTIASGVRAHFTAPSLSQYHFVSSQEVSSAAIHPPPIDEQMVWKVKRRKDGTRYIVRRPVRNRILRNRAAQISEERNELTTEDDTISEIKTGRYWTKEERKKHIERAKERRQRQQIVILNKTNTSASANIQQQSFAAIEPILNNRGHQVGYSVQQQPSSIHVAASGLAAHRPNTINSRLPGGSIANSEQTQMPLTSLHKKSTNSKKPVRPESSPVEANAPPIQPNTTATTSTTNGNKLVGLLSVTTV